MKQLEQKDFNMKIIKDIGAVFATENSVRKIRFAIFECSICKIHIRAQVSSVKKRKTHACKSCLSRLSATKHGWSGTRLYRIWKNIKSRCNNKSNEFYHRYGGRGISVCNEWTDSFECFMNWAVQNGYDDNLTIDRIDNDGNYEPSNCRWATQSIQTCNQDIRSDNSSGYRGVHFDNNKGRWCASIGINGRSKHIGYYDTAKEASVERDRYIIENKLPHMLND